MDGKHIATAHAKVGVKDAALVLRSVALRRTGNASLLAEMMFHRCGS